MYRLLEMNMLQPAPQNLQPAPLDPNDWRFHLLPQTRQTNIEQFFDLLTTHLPPQAHSKKELRRIAIIFEQKFYKSCTSQLDYSNKVSAKFRNMELRIYQAENQVGIDPDRTELDSSELSDAPADSEDTASS